MSLRTIACLTLLAAAGATPAVALAATDPQIDKRLGPGDGAGHYLGGQDSTGQWHGCNKSDTQWYPLSLISGEQTTAPSTHRYVTFTVKRGDFPYFSWKVKAGYTICGVESFSTLSSAETRGGQFLTWVSYKSGATTGTTATNGKETVKVHMPKKLDIEDQPDLEIYQGKTLGIDAFQAVSVYVKKK